jgi:hypothetical protein
MCRNEDKPFRRVDMAAAGPGARAGMVGRHAPSTRAVDMRRRHALPTCASDMHCRDDQPLVAFASSQSMTP